MIRHSLEIEIHISTLKNGRIDRCNNQFKIRKILGKPYFNDIKTFKVGNFQQQYPFHYVDKNWLTDDIIKSLEDEIR